uniref:ABC1 atypical kinase-like domain-containing protein n=1 Tax=Proboscia inermis TaxID=420281 RepID=A0A7S0GI33_9STRA
MMKSPFSQLVKVPQPLRILCTKNMLVMELLDGKQLSRSINDQLVDALDGDRALARELLRPKKRAQEENKEDDSGMYAMYRNFQKILSLNRNYKNKTSETSQQSSVGNRGILNEMKTIFSLILISKQSRKKLDLLIDVHGYQIFHDGVFNADPHPGNILDLTDGRIGLLDYGQAKRLQPCECIALAKVLMALRDGNEDSVADAMRELGFRSKLDRSDILAQTAAFYFDSDEVFEKLGYNNNKAFMEHLQKVDPMIVVPDAAVMVARTSILFRGIGSLLRQRVKISDRWYPYAKAAIQEEVKLKLCT